MKIPLKSFAGKNSQSLQLFSEIHRDGSKLTLLFELKGEIHKVLFSPLKKVPERQDGLWQTTCFEVFLSWAGNPFYYELNVSPSGDWNFYRFESYRMGQTRVRSFTQPKLKIETESLPENVWRAEVVLELSSLLSENPLPRLEVSMASVIEWENHEISYWALKHAGQKPDFHLRDSFILEV